MIKGVYGFLKKLTQLQKKDTDHINKAKRKIDGQEPEKNSKKKKKADSCKKNEPGSTEIFSLKVSMQYFAVSVIKYSDMSTLGFYSLYGIKATSILENQDLNETSFRFMPRQYDRVIRP